MTTTNNNNNVTFTSNNHQLPRQEREQQQQQQQQRQHQPQPQHRPQRQHHRHLASSGLATSWPRPPTPPSPSLPAPPPPNPHFMFYTLQSWMTGDHATKHSALGMHLLSKIHNNNNNNNNNSATPQPSALSPRTPLSFTQPRPQKRRRQSDTSCSADSDVPSPTPLRVAKRVKLETRPLARPSARQIPTPTSLKPAVAAAATSTSTATASSPTPLGPPSGPRTIAPTSPTAPVTLAPPSAAAKIPRASVKAEIETQPVPAPAPSASASARARSRDIIETEFSHEILLKHNELRLINQELARCQIALEQLRRCHLMPYPVSCPTPTQMLHISGGTGPVLANPGEAPPQWAPPFGVVDGPYARHYAKWLIPDPKFDGVVPEPRPSVTLIATHGRTTRKNSGAAAADASSGPAKRGFRGSIGQKLHSLPAGYPAPRGGHAGPCVIKRSDGQIVKLVCKGCNRENFSNTQGFLNHCRIAHHAEYKSHDEAAMACGVPLDSDALASGVVGVVGVGGASARVTAAKLRGSRASVGDATAATPAMVPSLTRPLVPSRTPAPATASGHVYALNRPDMTEKQAYRSLHARLQANYHRPMQAAEAAYGPWSPAPLPSKPRASSYTLYRSSPQLHKAPDAPYLSRLLQAKGFEGNLDAMVADAKTKEAEVDDDPDASEDEAEDEIENHDRGEPGGTSRQVEASWNQGSQSAMRMPARSTAAASAPVASSAGDGDMTDVDEDEDEHSHEHEHDAPSLVSDDGEYEDDEDDEDDDGSSEADAAEGDTRDGAVEPVVAHIASDQEHELTTRGIHRRRSSAGKIKRETRQKEPAVLRGSVRGRPRKPKPPRRFD